jgi:uncharacterized membrane protein
MKTRLRHAWVMITTGYWFVPSLMTAAGVALAFLMIAVDRHVLVPGLELGWVYGGGADGAKTLLSAVAGSVITVAGVVFSITVAALTQASSQFGPRLLRNFMRDTSNQVVLGTFVSTFMYCLLVLRTVHVEDGQAFVPHASVTVAVVLAAASIAVLIYFIHHVSRTLQAPIVIANVSVELASAIDRSPRGEPSAAGAGLPEGIDRDCVRVLAGRDGYVQAVDFDGLVALARDLGVVVRLHCRPGNFVIEGNALASVGPAGRWEAACEGKLRAAFIVGDDRTDEQDVEYSVRQIVEVAVRALSPGINDPFPAMNAVDALAAGVCRAAREGLAGPHHRDAEGVVRVVAPVTTFEGLVDAAFDQIRQYGCGSVAVALRLIEALTDCGGQCDAGQRAVLLRHAGMTYRQAALLAPGEEDRAALGARYAAAVGALGNADGPSGGTEGECERPTSN